MGLTFGEVTVSPRWCQQNSRLPWSALKKSPDLKEAYDGEEVTRELIDTAFILEDLTGTPPFMRQGL